MQERLRAGLAGVVARLRDRPPAQPLNARQLGIWLLVAGGMVAFYAIIYGPVPDATASGVDWRLLWRNAANGDFSQLTSPYWSLFLSYLPSRFPDPVGYAMWIGTGAVLVLLVANRFASPLPLVLASYQLNWVFFYGQIEPFVVAGIGLGAAALGSGNPWLTGVAMALTTLKPQVGGLVAVYLLLRSPSWWKSGLVYAAIAGLSLVVWPGWPMRYLSEQFGPFFDRYGELISYANTSPGLPIWLGLLLSIATLMLPLDLKRKLQALVAANLLVSPYSPLVSQLSLLCLGLPLPFYLFALVPWVVAIALGPFGHWQWGFIFPLSVLAYNVWLALRTPQAGAFLRRVRSF